MQYIVFVRADFPRPSKRHILMQGKMTMTLYEKYKLRAISHLNVHVSRPYTAPN
jgi:hypothetical protein